MTARPRIALVGSGAMGSLHARVIAASERAEFAQLIEQREDVGKEVAGKYGVRWAGDVDGLSTVDAVVIASATESHYDLAKHAMALGKPVLVEKPVAPKYEQSAELVADSERLGLPLMCGFLERFNPAILTAKQLVGDVVQVNAVRHSPFVPRIRNGVATDLLIHDVDLAIRLIGGPPSVVKGAFGYFHDVSKESRSEDSADATMTFPDGAIATISASRISQRKVRTISVLEVDRLIEVDLLRRDITVYKNVTHSVDGGGYRQQTIMDIPMIPYAAEPLAAQLDHFLDLIETGAGSDAVAEERAAILPAHVVIDKVTASASEA
ncbi:putative dehydrogenase [Herbihabitans rhizosphaerae]|uniref:Putative dehydrogenase n=1 Tax=Herbihabitans rhizosphaerae TaxID=1872711 RepID=A0A4Q7L8B5_9PSEU|nr:Gfo/Idh/MocA family oxidoreductase [Herbihabitans rhizosphaerae]RZS45170.1 putative dehydrogenase [Herbihabitans rhizosphaerae]